MGSAKFFLPWPDKRLSPNARVHWSALYKAKKKAKKDAYHLALESGLSKIDTHRLAVKYTFYPPDRRHRDLDNALSSMKAAGDGIALAIGVDDSKWSISIEMVCPIEKNGMVRVELEW